MPVAMMVRWYCSIDGPVYRLVLDGSPGVSACNLACALSSHKRLSIAVNGPRACGLVVGIL